jgi:hypothetical protein
VSVTQCIICGSSTKYYFTKNFHRYGLGAVDYYRCQSCGFTISKTHAEMSNGDWESLNFECHAAYQGGEFNPDDPRWLERLQSQANVLHDASQVGFLKSDARWLDYACGDGKLSALLSQPRYNLTMMKYDRYMPKREGFLEESDLLSRHFDFVVTTSVFEHFIRREQLDAVNALVSEDGVLGVHTLVCENVPADDKWFYLLPVHCSFHTNKSMSLLLQQWGYTSSVYNVESRLWLCFRAASTDVEAKVERANRRLNKPFYIHKNGFVDYWH